MLYKDKLAQEKTFLATPDTSFSSVERDDIDDSQIQSAQAIQAIDEQVSRGKQWTAEAAGLLGELGGGLYLSHKLHRSAKFAQGVTYAKRALQTASLVKKASVVGIVAPEGVSSVGGVLAYAGAEAAIWGVSNLAGQSIRKSMGVQEDYSAGEALAASVFGATIVNNVATKGFNLASKSLGAQNLWKTRPLVVEGTKLMVTGAALGVAETAMRQELQMLMGERENRSVSEYYLAAGIGGGLNTGFGLIASTGVWGRLFARKTAKGAKERMETQLGLLEDQLIIADAKGQRGRMNALQKQIETQKQAIAIADDVDKLLRDSEPTFKMHETLSGQERIKQYTEESSLERIKRATEEKPDTPKDAPDTDPIMESTIEGVPDARNAQQTQVGNTEQTVIRASNILNDFSSGKTLDWGSGRGKGAEAIGADTYEPFPNSETTPLFNRSTDIPSESYEKIISSSVLNVVPRDIRDGIVSEIGRVLKIDGYAIITARDPRTVASPKGAVRFEGEPNAYVVKSKGREDTYQKGFTKEELRDYVSQVLGDNFDVSIAPKGLDGRNISGSAVLIKKKAASDSGPTPIKRSNAELEAEGTKFLEMQGLGLEDFVIDPITNQPAPIPVSGATGSERKPTLPEIGAFALSEWKRYSKGATLSPSVSFPIRNPMTFGDAIDKFLDPNSGYLSAADGEYTQQSLRLLKTMRDLYPEAVQRTKIYTYGNQRAQFWEDDGKIGHEAIRIKKGEPLNTIVHEGVHAVTSRYIDKFIPYSVMNPKTGKWRRVMGKEYLETLEAIVKNESKPLLIRELSEVYLEVIKRAGVRKQIESLINGGGGGGDRVKWNGHSYGLGNLHEFLAEAMTSPQFQRELNAIMMKRQGRSAWSVFTDIIKRLFKIDIKKGSALDEVLSLTSAIARDNERIYKYRREKREFKYNKGKLPITPDFDGIDNIYTRLDPSSSEAISIGALSGIEKNFLPKGEITAPFVRDKRYGNVVFTGEVDGVEYSQASASGTKEEALYYVGVEITRKALASRTAEITKLISIKRVADENDLNIQIEPLNTLKLGVFYDDNIEITIRDEKGKVVRYDDLNKEMQHEVNLVLKAKGGVYINPSNTADIGTPKAGVPDPDNQLDFLNELDATTPPDGPPPLTEEGALGSGGDSRYDELRELRKRLNKYTDVDGEEMPSIEELGGKRQIQTEFAAIAEQIKRMDRDSKELMDSLLVEFSESGPSEGTLRRLYDEILFMRKANVVRDTIETTFGRTGLGLRKDAWRFAFNGRFSMRAIAEDKSLQEIEEVLRSMITGKHSGEDDSFNDLLQDFLDDFFDTDPDFVVDAVNVREELTALKQEEADASDLEITQEGEITPTEITPEGTKKKKKKNNSLTLDQKLAKREKRIKDQIKKLEERLDKAREEFVAREPLKRTTDADGNPVEGTDDTDLGLEDELIDGGPQPAPTPKPKDPRIERLQKLLSFYSGSRIELQTLINRKRERARLAAIEGSGDITLQKKELEKLKKDKKPTSLDEVNKDIAAIRGRMRQRLREIEAAERQLEGDSAADAAARIENKLRTKKERLQKQLDAYRARFTERGPTDDVAEVKRRKIEDEQTKQMERQIEFYRKSETEAKQTRELSEELARLAEIEGRGVVSELDATVGEKLTEPKLEDPKIKELRRKIAESKARMRKKLSDLEQGRFDQEQVQLAFSLEKLFIAQMNKDNASRFTRFIRAVRSARTMSLIAQVPSVLAGLPTGLFGMAKQFYRIPTKFLSSMARSQGDLAPRIKVAQQLARAETAATFAMFPKNKKEVAEFWESFKRSYFMNQSATDGMRGRHEEGNKYGGVRGIHALVVQARTNAQIRLNSAGSVANKMGEFVRLGKLGHIVSFGVRGIIAVDDTFKRMLLRSRVTSDSYRRALLEFPEGGAKMERRAQELYQTAWADQDGLPVLADDHTFVDELDNVRTELLFASNADNIDDVATSMIDKIIKPINKIRTYDNIAGIFLDALMPFFGVATRGVYRTGRIQFFPLLAVRATMFNPYTKKIKTLESDINEARNIVADKDIDAKQKEGQIEDLQTLTERLEALKVRRLKYNEEMLTDIMIGASIATMSMIGGATGMITGSMGYLSKEQRRKARELGVSPFRAFGMDYRAALPATFGISMYSDIGTFLHLRKLQNETGQPILDENLNLFEVMRRSAIDAVKEVPLVGGINTFEDLTSDNPSAAIGAVEKLVNSYVPVPAEARKIIKKITVDDRVVDLKGGTYFERLAYQAFGVGPVNYQTDSFGEDLRTDVNWVTETIWRQAPRFKKKALEINGEKILTFEDILLSDTQSIVGSKPTYLSSGIKMTEFINEDGVTLKYYYAQQLRTQTKQYRGAKRTLSEAVDVLINDENWIAKYSAGFKPDDTYPDKFTNAGLEQLNELMRSYYKVVRERVKKDRDVLESFINKDEQTLGQYMDITIDSFDTGTGELPFSLKNFFQ